MSKTRVYEYAKKHGLASKDLLEKATKAGITYNSHMSSMTDDEIKRLDQLLQQKPKSEHKGNRLNQTKNNTNKQKNTSSTGSSKNAQKAGVTKNSQSHTTTRSDKKASVDNHQKVKTANNSQANRNTNTTKSKFNDDEVFKKKNNSHSKQKKRRNNRGRDKKDYSKPLPKRKHKELPEVLVYKDGMTVADLAKRLHREPAELVKKLFMLGVMATQNQSLSNDAIELLAADYGIETKEKIDRDISDLDQYFEEAEEEDKKLTLTSRPPVVTIMGHVDHGKTTLLDQLRHTNVTEHEAGGITQHIGAYQIKINGKPITFLDTPGHAAFTTMRARGADITDICIIVVAADDGVMPQTVEAINHAKAAKVPIIVAVNKIDKPHANPDHVMQELSDYGLIPEAWGGETIFVNISAKFNQNIEELLEMILLVAEMQELMANPNRNALGTVIEARLDKSKGAIATLLVQEGTLKVGDPIVVGETFGRVRVMVNDQGRRVKTASPAQPVEITGLNTSPQAGDRFVVFDDEKTARAAGEERAQRAQIAKRNHSQRITLDNLFESLKEGDLKEVNVIIKADVQGSAEALSSSLQKIEVEGAKVTIVHSAVGAINESDITLAQASNAIVIGFNVRPTPQAKAQADAEDVDIRLHSVIYKVIDEIETAMKGLLDPVYKEQVTGQATVRETYHVSKLGTIAGAYVTDGVVKRSSKVRLIRDGIVIFEGDIASLKRFKDDAKEVSKGFECGIMIENYNDIKVDDVIEAYEMVEV